MRARLVDLSPFLVSPPPPHSAAPHCASTQSWPERAVRMAGGGGDGCRRPTATERFFVWRGGWVDWLAVGWMRGARRGEEWGLWRLPRAAHIPTRAASGAPTEAGAYPHYTVCTPMGRGSVLLCARRGEAGREAAKGRSARRAAARAAREWEDRGRPFAYAQGELASALPEARRTDQRLAGMRWRRMPALHNGWAGGTLLPYRWLREW